jgi:hypothetical protein
MNANDRLEANFRIVEENYLLVATRFTFGKDISSHRSSPRVFTTSREGVIYCYFEDRSAGHPYRGEGPRKV